MRHKPHPDALIAVVAERQHGVVTVSQLFRCGLSRSAIARRVARGLLFRVHRGVYAVGYPGLTDRGRWKAATLAVRGSLLSHRSAAELWGLLTPKSGDVHVSVSHLSTPGRRDGIRVFRSRSLPRERTTMRDGIPVTMPARTIADLTIVASAKNVRRAARAAERRNLPLDPAHRPDRTESDLEVDFLRICHDHDVPEPLTNVEIGRYRVDFLWPEQRLVIEVDGYIYHRGRQAMRDDNDRDIELALRGLQVVRIEDTRIDDDAAGLADAVLGLLGLAGRPS